MKINKIHVFVEKYRIEQNGRHPPGNHCENKT
jgi:hypothetical protein